MRIELFGVPCLLAGRRAVELVPSAATLGEAARALGLACPVLVGPVLEPGSAWLRDGYTFAVDGRFTRDPASPVAPGAAVLLVAAQAGG